MRLRFTVRWLMIVVAFIGLVMSLVTYREQLRRQAAYHKVQIAVHAPQTPASPSPPPGTLVVTSPETGAVTAYRMTPQAEWHARKESEYSGSAARVSVLITLLTSLISLISVATIFNRRKYRRSRGQW
ncbi:hypothetical protein SAMN05444166_5985 [Singulisphaera sp. GP187]|nr:hypothetical protein SAMN05444166_5985 [Singulisphaera sp. GP187]